MVFWKAESVNRGIASGAEGEVMVNGENQVLVEKIRW
jgi:hypothetical protein